MGSANKSLFERLRAIARDRALLVKATTFAGVGVVNTLIDFGVFSFAYLYIGLPIVLANLASWTIAVSASYVMNSMITFAAESQRKLNLKSYFSFVGAQIAGLLTNTATVLIASYFMPVLMGKLLAIGASFLVNFSLSHFVVFRPVGKAEQ